MDLKYFDEISEGEVRAGAKGSVTREQIIEFAKEFDPQPFHIDEEAATASVFGGLTASGSHIVALQNKLILQQNRETGSLFAVMAGLGWDEVRFLAPLRPDEVVTLRMECIEKRESASKPDRGILRWKITLENEQGETVLSNFHTIMVAKRNE